MRISDWSSDVCSSDLVARQAIEKDIGGDAARREPSREFIAFLVDHDIAIAAAGREDHRRAVGLHRAEDVEPRPDDMVEHAVAGLWVVAALDDALDAPRGHGEMAVGPERDAGIGREPGGPRPLDRQSTRL